MKAAESDRQSPPPPMEAAAHRGALSDEAPRRGWLVALTVVVVAGLVVGGYAWLSGRSLDGTSGLMTELQDRGRIAGVGGADLERLEVEGTDLVAASSVAGLAEALSGTDEGQLADVLTDAGVGNLVVDGRRGGSLEDDAALEARLRAYGNMSSLRGVYLTPTAGLYERRRGLMLDDELGEALARAARQIVGGARLPRIRAFPEPLRRTRNVEVMVMLTRGGRPRLWRSARGGSIARALITAASVARQRWQEREQAMGGPIDEQLPRMTVQVFLLEEDGTFDDRTPRFVERVFTEDHGVAFELRGSWHYLLPRATRERGEGSAMRAYQALFEEAGLAYQAASDGGADAEDSAEIAREAFERAFGRADIRLYRLVAREVGTSPPTSSAGASDRPLPLPSDTGSFGGSLGEGLLGPGALDGL